MKPYISDHLFQIVMSVLFTIAIIVSGYFVKELDDCKERILISEKRYSELHEDIAVLTMRMESIERKIDGIADRVSEKIATECKHLRELIGRLENARKKADS